MRRGLVIGAAILLTLSAVFLQAMVLPGRVVACSCAGGPPPLAEIAAAGDVAIVAGTVGRAQVDRTPVAVEGWFHGATPTDVVWLLGGTGMGSSCDIFMTAGERRILVLFGQPEGIYSANSCTPGALIGTPEADALLAEAVASFGEPQAPPFGQPEPDPTNPGSAPEAPAPVTPVAAAGNGLLWLAAGVGLAIALFGAVAIVAVLRRPG